MRKEYELGDGSSAMFTSEVSLMMRKGHPKNRKSRGGTSSQLHFGRIHCNNISEAASFVYDT